jgi:methylthioribose-1-phosphate isomerase
LTTHARVARSFPRAARRPIRRFDATPARLVTGIITERGVCRANAAALKKLSPEK